MWWGIALSVGGSLLAVVVPYLVIQQQGATNGVDQGAQSIAFRLTFEVVLRVTALVLPSLGAALIGAGVIMRYIQIIVPREAEHAFQLARDDSAER
jgi:ABC-type antimicrobial peptide transport system permease subunit